jgi:hypothetical protein
VVVTGGGQGGIDSLLSVSPVNTTGGRTSF